MTGIIDTVFNKISERRRDFIWAFVITAVSWFIAYSLIYPYLDSDIFRTFPHLIMVEISILWNLIGFCIFAIIGGVSFMIGTIVLLRKNR